MPSYTVTDPRSHRSVTLTGDRPPTEQELHQVFATINASAERRGVSAEDFIDTAPQPQGSASERFLSNAGAMLNPISAIEGLYQAARHPIDTGTNIVNTQIGQFSKAADDFSQGRYLEALGHGAAGALPLVGPAAAGAGQQISSGDIAGGFGTGAGLLLPVGAPAAARGTVRGARAVLSPATREAAAASLERGAAGRVADVMSPKVGANKTRFGNQAEKVAPSLAKDLATDGAPWTREGFHGQVQAKLAAAESELDAASSARNPKQVIHTKSVIDALRQKRAALTSETHRIGPFKAGADVVPGPNAGRVAQIDQAIGEIEQLGPVADYEALRRIRQAYDGPAKATYSPSMTADYLKAQGSKLGAADVTGVLREHLASVDPQTAAANATYSLYRGADDVMEATREVERTRPRVGRLIANRIFATVTGGQAAGAMGAAAGYVVAPFLDAGASMGLTTKLKVAAIQQRLANAIRQGNVQQVNFLTNNLREVAMRELKTTGVVQTGRLTSPSESQRGAAPVLGTP